MELKDLQKLLIDVLTVYREWLQILIRKLRPYNVHFTAANAGMFLVTFVAMIGGFVFLYRKRKEKVEQEKARRASLARKQEEEWQKARKRARLARKAKELEEVKDPYMAKVRQPPNCPFNQMFGGFMGDKESVEEETGEGRDIIAEIGQKIHHSVLEDRMKRGDLSDSEEEALLISSSEIKNISMNAGNVAKAALRDGRDPLEFAMHIPGEMKKIQNKVATREIEKTLSQQQKEEEIRTRREQLEQIFKLMQSQPDKFGPQSTEDMEEQLKMYSL